MERPAAIRTPGALQMGEVMAYLEKTLPADAIMTNGAGNYATWLHRFHRYTRYGTQLAPTSGSMGYGLPAAVGAKRVHPDKTVVCFAGDGCFLMHGQEFATAVQYDLPIIVVLVDNGMYGTIRMHQEKLSRPRFRHRAQEPRLRRLRARLRRPWRAGGKQRTVRPGLRTRAGQRQAGHPALPDRSGDHFPVDHAGPDPRRRPAGQVLAPPGVAARPARAAQTRLYRPNYFRFKLFSIPIPNTEIHHGDPACPRIPRFTGKIPCCWTSS